MKTQLGGVAGALLASLVLGVGEARAEGGFFNEIRVGVLDHDTDLVGSSKEDGIDLGVEVLSKPIEALDFLNAPRLALGAVINSEDQTNQIYAGLVAQWDFAHNIAREGDALFLEGAVGGAWHDGKIDVRGTPEEANWKSRGGEFVFRTGFGVGYRFDETWSLAFSFHHISNADLALPNEGSNDVGLRLGMRF